MAEQLPNLYTFGQVKVDTSSLADLQGKLLAKKQAKQEALDKYFEKQMGSLSREGIAKNDIPDYEKELSGVKDYWKQNAADIKKGGSAKYEFDNKMQGLRDFVSESKDKKAQTLKYREQFQFGSKTPTDDDMTVLGYMELPIRDPKRINPATGMPYGLSDLSIQAPAFDLARRNKFFGDVASGVKPTVREQELDQRTKKPKLITEGTEKFYRTYIKYSDNEIKQMEDKLALGFDTDKSASNYYKTILADPDAPQNAEKIKKLNAVWQSVPWHKGTQISSALDLAKAELLSEKYGKPVDIEKSTYSPATRAGGGGRTAGTGGAGDKWEDYYFLNQYTPQPIGNTGKMGIKANLIRPIQRKVLDNLRVIPIYDADTRSDWYIYDSPGKWRGEDDQIVTDEDVAEATAPAELKRKRKAGGTGGSIRGRY